MSEESNTVQVLGLLIAERAGDKVIYYVDWQLEPEIMNDPQKQSDLADILHTIARGMDRKIGQLIKQGEN